MIKRKKLNRAGPAIAAIACLAVLVTGTPASAATKTLSGEVHCSGMNKVERIWFLGSKSGWHGKDVPKSQRSYEMKYSFKAVQGETIQVWVDCTNAPERYSSFKVGSGSTRHVCDWGGMQVCTSTKLAGCVVQKLIGNKINLVGCLRYA